MLTTPDPVLFRAKNVRITSLLIRIGSTSYPVANLTSVSLRDPRGITSCYALGWLLLAVGVALLLYSTPEHDCVRSAMIFLFLCLIVFARAILTRQWLILHTAGTEVRALRGSDAVLAGIKRAIEKAIIARG